jgi:hypothetical protein
LAVVLLLGALLVTLEARAGDTGPLLVFDSSAAALPQAEIRAAVEKELGKPLATWGDAGSGELSVGVDPARGLVVRYRTATGSTERYLPMPKEPSDVPLIISLAAGNLARDQSVGVPRPPVEEIPTTLAEDVPPKAPEKEPVLAAFPSPPAPPRKRHFVGLHVAQDIAAVGGSNVCDANLGQKTDNYACFYEGTSDEPFFHTPFPYEDQIDTGLALATTRLLFSYDYAIAPALSLGARVGYAFGGGPPAGQEPLVPVPDANLNNLPAHTKGKGGVSFLPLHVELRANVWFLPLDGRPFSANVGAGFGVAQVDARVTVDERDCAATLPGQQPPWDSAANGTFDDCAQGRSNFNWKELPETKIDAWKKLGQGFVSLSVGGLFPLAGDLAGFVNVNTMLMFPSNGFVFEPSLGVMMGL